MFILLIFAVNARQGMGRRERGEGGFPKTDATTILADEQKGVFRVLDIGRPRPAGILRPTFSLCGCQCFGSGIGNPDRGRLK
jgi:hypothetical protein